MAVEHADLPCGMDDDVRLLFFHFLLPCAVGKIGLYIDEFPLTLQELGHRLLIEANNALHIISLPELLHEHAADIASCPGDENSMLHVFIQYLTRSSDGRTFSLSF